jgi:hypothetical protein
MIIRSSDWFNPEDDPPQFRSRFLGAAVVFAIGWVTVAVGLLVCLVLRLF